MNVAQNNLFGEIAIPPQERRELQISERRRKAKQAYQCTSEVWKKAVYRFATENFLPVTETFLFEELSIAYEEWAVRFGGPLTVQKKAFAGLQRILICEGKIELLRGVTRMRSNGQMGLVYKSSLWHSV